MSIALLHAVIGLKVVDSSTVCYARVKENVTAATAYYCAVGAVLILFDNTCESQN